MVFTNLLGVVPVLLFELSIAFHRQVFQFRHLLRHNDSSLPRSSDLLLAHEWPNWLSYWLSDEVRNLGMVSRSNHHLLGILLGLVLKR